jgi:hypothetical protein
MSLQALNAIPIIGWLLTLVFTASLAVPFWFAWTVCDIGKTYFYFLPQVYHAPGFWATVGIFISVGTLKLLLFPSVNVHQTNKD